MKFHFFLSGMFIFYSTQAQQNLVGNGSFEDYSDCPSEVSQITNAIGWLSFRQSPDYFSECATSSNVTVPGNLVGYQFPFEGIAFSGVYTWRILFPENQEFAAKKLTEPLQIGSVYFISFRTCLAIDKGSVCLATNHIGAKFTNTLYTEGTPMPVDNNPAIDYPFFITDTVNWTHISGWYVADSNYTYIVLGNFFNGNLTDTINITKYTNPAVAYYYIDSVSVTQLTEDGINPILKIAPRLFYNPANEFCIASTGTQQILKAEVSNFLGQEMKCEIIVELDRIKIKTSGLSSGSYFVKLHDRERIWTLPLIVQH